MSQKANNIIIGILLILALILLIAVGHYKVRLGKIQPNNDTIVRVHYDTVYNTIIKTVEKPILRRVETIKHDTVYQTKDTVITLPIEKKIYSDTIICEEADSVIVESTIVGINPSLESIKAKLKRREINQTTEKIITKYIEKEKRKSFSDHFYIGVGYTAGYDPFNKRPAQVVGLSAGIRF